MSKEIDASRSQPSADASSAPLKPSEVLEKAAALIEPEGAWTKFVGAWVEPILSRDDVPIDDEGEVSEGLSPDDPQARCWCLEGAIWGAAAGMTTRETALKYVGQVIGEGYSYVFDWNDEPGRTQAEVVAALRKAAELAREAGQ